MNPTHRLATWLRRLDPALAATRRAARTAVVMPAIFALCTEVLHTPVAGTYAAFAAFSMLLLVEFTGPWAQRMRAHVVLGVVWVVLVSLGSLAGREIWIGAAATVLVAFLVLFSGVISSVLAGATTSLLLAFVLPVATRAPLEQLPQQLMGVVFAASASTLAVRWLWPRSQDDPLSAPAAQVCRAAAAQLAVEADYFAGRSGAAAFRQCRSCARETEASARRLQRAFTATPYRPTGLSTESRTLVRLVDELTWLSAVLAEAAPGAEYGPLGTAESSEVRRTAASVLDMCAQLLDDPDNSPEKLLAGAAALRAALTTLEDGAVAGVPSGGAAEYGRHSIDTFVDSLDVSFRAEEIAFVVLQIAQNVGTARTARRRSWWDHLLGRVPGAPSGPLTSAMDRAGAHVEPHSVWLHNSIRGAIGLGAGVVVADFTGVQHAFWVLLGILSVLRSNALNTGQNAFRALGGTLAGSIVGFVLLQAIGHNAPLLWTLLPIAVMLAGIVPAAVSFAAGQAAFTLTLAILFNVAQPAGASVLLFRIEDIALGCVVSLVVGFFFWPRGASGAVRKALAEAYSGSARYLLAAVDYAVSCCVNGSAGIQAPQESRQAAAAARRLDDAFRTYLAERGGKTVPLCQMSTLVAGVAGLRLAGDAVLELWRRSTDRASLNDRAAAQRELIIMAERILRWYETLADGLVNDGSAPEPLDSDSGNISRLIEAVGRDLRAADGQATKTGVRVIWTGNHLDAARRLQIPIAAATGDASGQGSVGSL